MKIGIGVSTGTEVVCAALIVVDDDGTTTVEYRTVSSDREVNTDIGDLVASAIELMASLAPSPSGRGAHVDERRVPDAIAVSHRTPEHATSIRSALAHSSRTVHLVPESAAAFAFLDDSGLVARYETVTVVDVGAAGTTATVIDARTGAVRAEDRTVHFGGDVVNRVVKDLVAGADTTDRTVRDDLRDDRGVGSARYRAVKEHLSTHDSAEVGGLDGSATVDRAAFEDAISAYVVDAATFSARTAESAGASPEASVVIGGGANIPVVIRRFESTLQVPVIVPSEPDTVLAKGAAHLALASPGGGYPTVGVGADGGRRSLGKFSGAAVGALLVGGIVLAYVVQTLAPSDDPSVSPAGTAVPSAENGPADLPIADGASSTTSATTATRTPSPSSVGSTGARGSELPARGSAITTVPAAPSSTPALRPAPDLPLIPWPARPVEPSDTSPSTPSPSTASPSTPAPTEPSTPPTSPSPGESTENPPTGEPGTPEPPLTTPGLPAQGSGGSTELSPPPTPSVPTTDVNGTPPSPGLAPPATVWTPPPPSPALEPSSPATSVTTPPVTTPTVTPPVTTAPEATTAAPTG